MSEKQNVVRCAIYTRKSTEEGLEQEFNTLQAQREAAEAYIASQRQFGWVALTQRYDDGGFSGANLDRPALNQLLTDVETGKVDCVLVYKVDRLSRSLLDFSRMIELFDQFGVSFVSVTQDFNTRTSLGRLTLNILLSFAQFEREIIGERTRDKLGAARRKGKWIGGMPVLGYDVDAGGGRLVVNEAEAERVREIFAIAATAKRLHAALHQVQARDLTTKEWTSKAGERHGGGPFTRSTLRRLLSNVLYTGRVSYKGVLYSGEHTAIVEQQLWDEVNERLALRSAHVQGRAHARQKARLAGLLHCGGCGLAMIRAHTTNRGRRYEYYICPAKRSREGRECARVPVAAIDIEGSLTLHLAPTFGDQVSWPVLQQKLERVTYDGSSRRVSVELRDGTGLQYLLPEPVRPGVPARGVEDFGRVPRISRLMALAIKFDRLVREGTTRSHRDLAEVGRVSRARMSQILRLADLAPAIQEQLLFLPKTRVGADPITERSLREIAKGIDWDWQLKKFRSLMDSSQSS